MITVDNLSFCYAAAAQPAVRNLSFAVYPGEIFGFLGPSGAGKSTTQKVLTGILSGYQGRAQVLGRELQRWGADLYEQVGVSFEAPNHFLKLTGRENLAYFGALYRSKTETPEAVLRKVGLENDADLPVAQYSKGMKNRLTVARALLHHPKLLFLDEPTAGLDPVNARSIKNLILEQRAAGVTIFLTTHDMHIADEICDRIALIVDGEIQEIDSPRDLKLRFGRPSVQVEYGVNGQAQAAEFQLAGLGENGAFLAVLRSGQVRTLHTQEATLEEVFIQATGRRLAG